MEKPPYEYEYEKLPIDFILGNYDLRLAIRGQGYFLILENVVKGV
jgi:hypothetical protein